MPNNTQQESINRRRQMAQALQQSAILPIQSQRPDVPIHATQGLAKLAEALFAGLINRKLDKQQSALDTQTEADRQSQFQAIAQAVGRPELAQAIGGEFGGAILADALAGKRQASDNDAAMARVLAGKDPARIDPLSEQGIAAQKQLAPAPTPQRIDPLSPEGIAAQQQLREAPTPRNIDPLSPEGIAAQLSLQRSQGLIPGRDIPLPADVEAQRVRMNATRSQAGRPVLSGDANRIADYDTSLDDLKTLRKEIGAIGATGTSAKVGAMLPNAVTDITGWGVDAKKKQAVIDRVKQVIGKALEGGVLRKEDEYKYEKILPTIADTSAVVKSKLDGLESAIGQRRGTLLDSLQDAGFEVSRYQQRSGGTPAKADPLGIR